MASVHQQNVARYHAAMAAHVHHGGHDMYRFHRDWHQSNWNPNPPANPDRNWGMDLAFGTNFLQMHHEMVKAPANEPRQHMAHESLVQWYQRQSIDLPAAWTPGQPIPDELGYTPDPAVFPDEIRQGIQQIAQQQGISLEQALTRSSNGPTFQLPGYFTVEGVGPTEPGEPITGARKLADYKNANQLGCCLVFPHNQWHLAIGGAMGYSWTAIADPIFYFGVHWHIDRVYDDYKSIQAERSIRPLDHARLFELHALESEGITLPPEFTDEQKAWAEAQVEISKRLHRLQTHLNSGE
jgi:hypothetical protein